MSSIASWEEDLLDSTSDIASRFTHFSTRPFLSARIPAADSDGPVRRAREHGSVVRKNIKALTGRARGQQPIKKPDMIRIDQQIFRSLSGIAKPQGHISAPFTGYADQAGRQIFSKLTSRIQETSRPSESLALSKNMIPPRSVAEATKSNARSMPTGFLTNIIQTSRSPTSNRSIRPKAACVSCSAATNRSKGKSCRQNRGQGRGSIITVMNARDGQCCGGGFPCQLNSRPESAHPDRRP